MSRNDGEHHDACYANGVDSQDGLSAQTGPSLGRHALEGVLRAHTERAPTCLIGSQAGERLAAGVRGRRFDRIVALLYA